MGNIGQYTNDLDDPVGRSIHFLSLVGELCFVQKFVLTGAVLERIARTSIRITVPHLCIFGTVEGVHISVDRNFVVGH